MPNRAVRLLVLLVICLVAAGCRTTVVREQPTPTPGAPATIVTSLPPPVTMVAIPASPATTAKPQPAASPQTAASPNPTPAQSSAPAGSPVAAANAAPAGSPSPAACQYGRSRLLAHADDRAIKEASALVASQRWPGIYWTLNDSGNGPTIYALDEQGRDRGSFRVRDAENDDWEAMQLAPGKDGQPALYIGDIGDNDATREEITLYRVPEPEPLDVGAKSNNGHTAEAEVFTLTYADGPRDAEALLIHPTTGELLILTKEAVGQAGIYRLAGQLETGKRHTLERIGTLDLAAVGIRMDVVNDGTVAADGRRVAVRTYRRVLEFDVPAGAALAGIWGQEPRVTRLEDGPQAESISYRVDGSALISISEGEPGPLYETAWQCG